MRQFLLSLMALCSLTTSVFAEPRELRVPLEDGRLSMDTLAAKAAKSMHLPSIRWHTPEIDLNGLQGNLFVAALNTSLGDGCNVAIDKEALVIVVDSEKLPDDFDEARLAARVFTAVAAPDATAAQIRFYGLLMPHEIDQRKPMVVMIHGLDCNRTNWHAMADLLNGEGFQVAYFTYPSDQPLSDSAEFLRQQIGAVREAYPSMRLDFLAHSMGALVARAYLEGPDYAGGVEHFIMIGPPNAGSKWARYRLGLEFQEHYYLWKNEPTWHPTWMITDGLGEAGRDLHPTSEFLLQLNAQTRRADVKYTIIAGNRHLAARVAANAIDSTDNWIPDRANSWWGVRHCQRGIDKLADEVRTISCSSDGPVKIKSTLLDGVEDYVVLPADHTTLYCPVDDSPPIAWATIKDRLAR